MRKVILSTVVITFTLTMVFLNSCSSSVETRAYVLPTIPLTGVALPYTVLLNTQTNVQIRNGGFGSAAVAHPTNPGEFYALTDRGPNTKVAGGKIFPVPSYNPRIGHFRLTEAGVVEKIKDIILKNPTGQPITGLPNPAGKGATGETPYTMDMQVLQFDDYGIDSEGLVAMKDGSFWISDEYGPHIVHFNAQGVEVERISPVNVLTGQRKLPAVFERRRANRGMEGLAITPDESTLVGIMQSTIYNPSKEEVTNKTLTRIVTFNLATGATKQYLYQQVKNNNSNSEITALSNTEFLVIERDGLFSGNGAPVQKQVYKINLAGATDVSGDFNSMTGKLVNGKTLEQNSWDELKAAGIFPVTKTLAVDLNTDQRNYPHDKLEGIWLIDNNTIGVLNDDDFAIWADDSSRVIQKTLPPASTSTTIDGNRLYIVKF